MTENPVPEVATPPVSLATEAMSDAARILRYVEYVKRAADLHGVEYEFECISSWISQRVADELSEAVNTITEGEANHG